jgi:hypothetical protein
VITFKGFTGINNVLQEHEMKARDLTQALNVDVDRENRIRRRQGYTLLDAGARDNLFEARGGFTLYSRADGSLVARRGAAETVVHPSISPARVWYVDLPDQTTLFSNSLVAGITDGTTSRDLGVPVPQGSGAFMSIPGALDLGRYQWATTYIRLSDGLEGGTSAGGVADVTEGGLLLSGMPLREGYKTAVYLSHANGSELFLAGETHGPALSLTQPTADLVVPCRTQFMSPLPTGTLCAFWRGRVLVAAGPILAASRPDQWELHDPGKDIKQFTAPITLIQPVADGIFVGTEHELAFLSGTNFDSLTYTQSLEGAVVLGSGATVPGEKLLDGSEAGKGRGDAMVCIVSGYICAGRAGGAVEVVTDGRYRVGDIAEVVATFRETRGIPQYLATPV